MGHAGMSKSMYAGWAVADALIGIISSVLDQWVTQCIVNYLCPV